MNQGEKIIYSKKPLTIRQQIAKLKSRGLLFDDEDLASDYLSNISYYRLRAYTYPFQNNSDEEADHAFLKKGIRFKDIIELYCFDRRLRSLVFNAIEKIEVSFRAKIVQTYSETTNNSHWYEDSSLFRQASKHEVLLEDIQREINRSNEDFIKHYKSKYSSPLRPPSWMTLEVVSLGTLSRLYELLIKDENKKRIAQMYGLSKIDIMENWMHALSNLRNCCAHHSRVWNRRFIVNLQFPTRTPPTHLFLDRETMAKVHKNKLFAYLCCIKYVLDIISPGNDFKQNLLQIMSQGGDLLSLKDMGFPDNWRYLGVWR